MEVDKKKKYKISCKLVLLGKTAVGKSSCVMRYINNKFEEFSTSTQGVAYVEKNVEIEEENFIKVAVWDTAGQERYK
jgi:small GTP-binding protein